ncbi:MAG: PAS domain S-box protein [Candidatus Pacebacteria bacterium]|nr:PAS domain S-box protein [Candidatus Paceibacterota bacterium]
MKNKKNDEIQAKLEESEIRYRRLFESAYDGILILDSDTGQITDVNPYLEKLLGYTKEEFLNKKLWEVGSFKNMKASRDAFNVIQRDGYVRYEDLPLETKDGHSVDVEFVSNSYLAGGVLVIQCNIRDITYRKKIESIKVAKKLLEAERERVESIANTAHELRTPIAIIKGNVDISYKKSNQHTKVALRAINLEVERLSDILADIGLITTRAWDLKEALSYQEVDLALVINTVCKRSKVIALKKHIKITIKKIPKVMILGDKRYLERMFLNLLDNSIVHGYKNGHTVISATKQGEFVKINVTDNGSGIAPEDLGNIFLRFFQGDKSHHGAGVGLGLSIVKWAVDLHGGDVSVVNNIKRGSTFSVLLPIVRPK